MVTFKNMSKCREVKPEKKRIHPVFKRSRFPDNFDYQAFRKAAWLASKLIDTPQALHWGYAMAYGTNSLATSPAAFANQPRDENGRVLAMDRPPRQYACNKAIGQLSTADNKAVRTQFLALASRVSFVVGDLEDGTVAQCSSEDEKPGVHGCDSIITISQKLYDAALEKDRTPEHKAYLVVFIAMTLVHEMAHALHHHLIGDHVEDFFESSLVAECGLELESRIFGMWPSIDLDDLDASVWSTWQSYNLAEGNDLARICRNEWKLPKTDASHPIDVKFLKKLCSSAFWEDQYLKRGALALVPPSVAEVCRRGRYNKATQGIPISIKDLFRTGKRSYAERKYGRFANPRLVLRS